MRNEIQKAKHKLDGDLRCSQEAALELERSKAEVQQAIQRKDKEFAAIQAKIEDEQGLGSKLQKQVKELGVSFEPSMNYGILTKTFKVNTSIYTRNYLCIKIGKSMTCETKVIY